MVEAAILNELSSWVHKYDIGSESESDAGVDANIAVLNSLQKRRETVQRQLSSLYDLLEQGIYTPAIFTERRGALDAQMAEIDSAIARLTVVKREDPRRLVPHVQTVIDAYPRAQTPEEKNVLLRSVIDHVDYAKTTRRKRNSPPGDALTLTIYPKYPDSD